MKKYITPAFDVVALETESMLAGSLDIKRAESGNTDETGTQRMDNNPIWGE